MIWILLALLSYGSLFFMIFAKIVTTFLNLASNTTQKRTIDSSRCAAENDNKQKTYIGEVTEWWM